MNNLIVHYQGRYRSNRNPYAGGNPVGYVDPTGEMIFPPILNFSTRARAAIRVGNERHLNRNANMTNWVCNVNEVNPKEFRKVHFLQNSFHIFPTAWPYQDWKNVKYVDIKTGRQELIFDGNGKLVTHSRNGPSYNFVGPDEALGHILYDVVPWLIWGNGPTFAPDCSCE